MKRIIRFLFLVPLFGGMIVLSLFIYRSAHQSALIEKEHIYGEAVRDIERAVSYSSENIKELYTVLRVSSEERESNDLSRIELLIKEWKEENLNSGSLKEVFVVSDRLTRWQRFENNSFVDDRESSQIYSDAFSPFFNSERIDLNRIPRILYLKGDIFLIRSVNEGVNAFLLVLLVNPISLFEENLRDGLDNFAEDFNYRLMLGDRVVISQKFDETRHEDLMISFTPQDFFFFWKSDGFEDDQVARFFKPPAFKNEMREDEKVFTPFFLAIQHKDQSLDNYVRERFITTLIINYGLLVLLVAAFLVLWRLYERNREMRNQEKEFVASVTHELKTPLAVIRSATGNLTEGIITDPERIARYGKLIDREAARLNRQVESILLYSGIEKIKDSGLIQSFSPGEICESIVDMFGDLAQRSGIHLELENRMGEGEVMGDPVLFRQVAENLIQNAIKHGNGAEKPHIKVFLEFRIPHKWIFRVEDNGDGIPSKEQRTVFQPFSRGKMSIKENTPGTGLGLYLVKKTATRMKGIIKMESPWMDKAEKEHRGCRFTIEFPQENI